jgi:hypothetical protein
MTRASWNLKLSSLWQAVMSTVASDRHSPVLNAASFVAHAKSSAGSSTRAAFLGAFTADSTVCIVGIKISHDFFNPLGFFRFD